MRSCASRGFWDAAGTSSYILFHEGIIVPLKDNVNTTDGAVRVINRTIDSDVVEDTVTTKGDQSVVPMAFGKPDPPTRCWVFDYMRHRFASPNPLIFNSLHWAQFNSILLGVA